MLFKDENIALGHHEISWFNRGNLVCKDVKQHAYTRLDRHPAIRHSNDLYDRNFEIPNYRVSRQQQLDECPPEDGRQIPGVAGGYVEPRSLRHVWVSRQKDLDRIDSDVSIWLLS